MTVESVLPMVADSWERLRGCDVYRLLDQVTDLDDAACTVLMHRPDLVRYVTEAMEDIAEERSN